MQLWAEIVRAAQVRPPGAPLSATRAAAGAGLARPGASDGRAAAAFAAPEEDDEDGGYDEEGAAALEEEHAIPAAAAEPRSDPGFVGTTAALDEVDDALAGVDVDELLRWDGV